MARKTYHEDVGTFDKNVYFKLTKGNQIPAEGTPIIGTSDKTALDTTFAYLFEDRENKKQLILRFLGHPEATQRYYLHGDGRILLCAICDIVDRYAKEHKKHVHYESLPCTEIELEKIRAEVEREALEYVSSVMSKNRH